MDRVRAYRRVWEAFRRTDRIADGRQDTPDWRARAGPFAVCCIRVPIGPLRPAIDDARAEIASLPHTRVHPDGFLHIMLQEFGFVVEDPAADDEIDQDRLVEVTEIAVGVGRARGPFEIALGWANAFQDAIFLELHKGGNTCTRLHQRLYESVSLLSAPRFPYLPHATIAHFTADASATGFSATLAPFREREFGRFTVRHFDVATLRVDEPYPPLETYVTIPLTG